MEPLAALNDLSMNFYWSWHPEGSELFRELDPSLWEKYEQNPRLLLRSVNELRLLQKSTDQEYVDRLRRFRERFDAYTGEPAQAVGRISSDRPVAYFCAEYGVHNSLPIYSGGLGILAGDHLKSASDLNIPLVAVGLLYRYGYFRQSIGHNGWQEESYQDILGSDLALTPVLDPAGERVLTMVHLRGREVFAQAWLARVGRISLYLLDTNIEQNAEVDRMITGHLYGGSSETRIVQEKVLGIGGVRLLRRLGISPSVFHLNEGHSAFLTLELAREYLVANPDADFLDSIPAVREQCVFTTHTPVSAGNDLFSTNEIRDCFDAGFIETLKLNEEELFELGRIDPDDKTEGFGMTPLAIRMCRSANGVSEKHGDVSRGLWKAMFPGADETADVPITHVTNGVHAPTWVAPLFQGLYRSAIGEDWNKRLADPDDWAYAVDNLSEKDVWSTHILLKRIMIAFVRERTQRAETGERDTINEHQDTRKLFSPDVLTIGFARRVAAYKRWNLMLSDIDRLLKLVDDPERPVQFVFAGKAHPQDKTAKQILQQLMSINHDSNWQRRAVFIEDYDQEVARYLVHGVDVWMNVPRRPHEASGTSGMKAAMNGALNFSILDGWWIEGYNGRNGFKIGELAAGEDDEVTDAADASALYEALENEVIPLYYDRGKNGVPSGWIAMMKNALATLTPQFASDRMVRDYLSQIYNNA
ncbi:MAG: alpha-glucan family phosphorylase [Acidobacteria bacterium]|nr:alpha-glucan family phosphorylase [Acidobacteriota bacterium]